MGSYLDLSNYSGSLPHWLEDSALCKRKIMFFLQGIKEYSVPVGLDGKAQVDLVVVGSVAVSEKGKIKPCKLVRRRILSRDSPRQATLRVPFGRPKRTFGITVLSSASSM